MKYKVGDKVRVRKDLEIGKCYGGVYFRKDMLSLLGYSLTVSSVNPNGFYVMDNYSRYWTDEMLEDVDDDEIEAVTFEAGKWYKGEANNYYFKAAGGVKDSVTGYHILPLTERIIDGQYSARYSEWSNTDFEKFALKNPVDLSEIQQYLPEGHPDKLSPDKQFRESLLEEAKRRYPVGTKFRSASDGRIYVVHKSNEVSLFISSFGDWIVVRIDDEGHKQHVYYDNKWAEIVESHTVKQKITPNGLTPIGGWYPADTYDRIYTVWVDLISFGSSKNKGESNSPTNESDFPIISTKRIINFSQLT